MENLGQLFGKILAEKKIAGVSKGYMIQSLVNNFLTKHHITAGTVKVKITYNILVLKVSNNSLKYFLFVNRKTLLQQINNKLDIMKLGKIKDIKIL